MLIYNPFDIRDTMRMIETKETPAVSKTPVLTRPDQNMVFVPNSVVEGRLHPLKDVKDKSHCNFQDALRLVSGVPKIRQEPN